MQSGDAQQASRGSSVLTDNARFQGNLVGMSQGEAKEFDVDESRRRFFVRLSFAGPTDDIEEALRRIGAWL